VQFEQAEGVVGEFRCALHGRAGHDFGKLPVVRSISISTSTSGIECLSAGAGIVWCGVWCHVHRPTGDGHRCGDREPIDDHD
jgi:hypothetical protein